MLPGPPSPSRPTTPAPRASQKRLKRFKPRIGQRWSIPLNGRLPALATHHVSSAQAAHYRSPAWRARRQQALEAAGNACEACGRKALKGLHGHHRFGVRNDPEDQWVVILCPTCHDTVELMARRRSRLTPELIARLVELARDKIRGGPE